MDLSITTKSQGSPNFLDGQLAAPGLTGESLANTGYLAPAWPRLSVAVQGDSRSRRPSWRAGTGLGPTSTTPQRLAGGGYCTDQVLGRCWSLGGGGGR